MIRKSVEALEAYVPGEQPTATDIVKLNTNENPYPPSPRVAEALRALSPEILGRYPPPACAPLRAKIAEQVGCDVDQVFVGNGSDEILALCTRAFVENDGTIGYLEPSYSLYPVLADIRDVEHHGVALGEDFEWPADPIPAFSLFFLTNPNAPTSLQAPKTVVADFCRRSVGVVVVDEAYGDFAQYHCADLACELGNTLVVRTLSKSYSLAGLRLGYAVGHPSLIGALMKIKDSYNVGVIAQRLAYAALSDPEHMRANADRVRATRSRLTAALRDRGYSVTESSTNFLWVRPVRLDAQSLFQALRDRNVLIRYFSGERVSDYVRITIGTDDQIDRLITAIDDIDKESHDS